MATDTLFLLDTDFASETGARQFCPDCMLIEGVLASYPAKVGGIAVVHVPFEKLRAALVAVAGAERQSCPALVRKGADGAVSVIDDPTEILRVLRDDYAIPAARGRV